MQDKIQQLRVDERKVVGVELHNEA